MIKPILGVAVVITAAASLTVATPAQALAVPTPSVSATTSPLLGATTPALLGVGGVLPDYVIDICRYMPGLPGCPRS